MTPPTILLDRTFLAALADASHEHADRAGERYAALVQRYRDHEIRLRARQDHLAEIDQSVRRTLLAPVERISVARQFRRQADRLDLPFGVEPDVAVTLVVMRRESIAGIASFDESFDQVAVERIS
ncbi:MAG: hypothetical protein WEB78_04280 [Ilumatobacteraceae bacterium]